MEDSLVRRMRIPLLVGERMMLHVVRNPHDGWPLDGHGAEDQQNELDNRVRLEALMCQQSVVADRDAKAGGDEAHDQQDEMDGANLALRDGDGGSDCAYAGR